MELIDKIFDIRKEYIKKLANKRILVCCGTGCTSSKSALLLEKLQEEVKKEGIKNITVEKTGCFGFCAKGPIVVIDPEEIFYEQVKKVWQNHTF